MKVQVRLTTSHFITWPRVFPVFRSFLKVHTQATNPWNWLAFGSCQPSLISKTSSRYQQKQFHEEVHVYPGIEIANRSCWRPADSNGRYLSSVWLRRCELAGDVKYRGNKTQFWKQKRDDNNMDKLALTHTHAAYHVTFAFFQRPHLKTHPSVKFKQTRGFAPASCLHPCPEQGVINQKCRYKAPQFNLHPARPVFSLASSLFPHTRRDKPHRPVPFLSTRNEKRTVTPSFPFLSEGKFNPFLSEGWIFRHSYLDGCGWYQDRETWMVREIESWRGQWDEF